MSAINTFVESTLRSLRVASMIDSRKLHVLFRKRTKQADGSGWPVEFPIYESQRAQAAKIASILAKSAQRITAPHFGEPAERTSIPSREMFSGA